MKLIFQIALGVFLGSLSSQFVFDSWHRYQENISKQAAEKLQAEQEKVRIEQGERIRAMILQSRQSHTLQNNKAPAGFVPDDAQAIPNSKPQ
jgi:DNA-directed RNA polymerase subunit E'/Rpb7